MGLGEPTAQAQIPLPFSTETPNAAPPTNPLLHAPAVTAVESDAVPAAHSVCRGVTAPLSIDSSSAAPDRAEFQIGVDGTIVRHKVAAADLDTVAFFSEQADSIEDWQIIVRVDAIATAKGGGSTGRRAMQCGLLQKGQRFKLDRRALAGSGADIWRLSVHVLRDSAKPLGIGPPKPRSGANWTDRFSRAQANEETFVFAKMGQTLVGSAGRIKCVPSETPKSDCPMDVAMLETIDTLPALLDDQLRNVERLLREDEKLAQYAVAQQPLEHLVDALRELQQKALRVKEQRIASYVNEFNQAWEQLLARGKPRPPEPDCKEAWLFNVQSNPALSSVWPFGMFELPTTAIEQTIVMPINGVTPPKLRLTKIEPISAWATFLPPDAKASFSWAASDSTALNGFKALGTFIAVLARLEGGGSVPGASPAMLANRAFVDRDQPTRAVGSTRPKLWSFEKLTGQDQCPQNRLSAIESPLAALTQYESRVQTSAIVGTAGLLKDRVYTISVCSGDCASGGNSTGVSAKTLLTTPTGWGLTLLGALAYDVPMQNKGQFTSLEWRPTTSIGQNQQIYEIAEVQKPLQSLSTSLLLTLLFPEGALGRFGIGAGPSIVFGSGSGVLQQWTVNMVYQPPGLRRRIVDKLFLMAGFGFRLIDTPIAQNVGDTVVLDLNNQQTPQTPSIAMRTTAVGIFSVGLALDLSLISDAALSLFGIKAPNASN